MLENDEVLELFKKSLTATIKSIGKSDEIEVNFVQDSPSVDGKIINITEPNHRLIKEKLNYIRAQADSIALEFRLHEKKIHQSYISQNEITNDIFNAIEQSRIEAKGSKLFKGIKKNILNKHNSDLNNQIQLSKNENPLIQAFRYVSYSELTGENLTGNYEYHYKLIKDKLGDKYISFFDNLKQNISNQKNFADQVKDFLLELGLYDNDLNKDNDQNVDQDNDVDDNDNNKENKTQEENNKKEDNQNPDESSSKQQLAQVSDEEELGDQSSEDDMDYFPTY